MLSKPTRKRLIGDTEKLMSKIMRERPSIKADELMKILRSTEITGADDLAVLKIYNKIRRKGCY